MLNPETARTARLLQRAFLSSVVRLAAHPRMLGDVEHGAVGTAELDLEESLAVALVLSHEAFGSERFQELGGLFGIIDQDAEMMHAGEVHTLADLVGLELQHRDVERAVAQEISGG